MSLLYSSADYGIHDDTSPTYGADETSYWGNPRQIVCKPEKMVISDWLRPVYEGISEIVVGLPVKLIGWQHLIASGNGGSTATLRNDLWDDPHDCCPFASAVNQGDGYIVLIAGNVSGDVWLKRCPDNTKWLINLSRFLVNEASLERDR